MSKLEESEDVDVPRCVWSVECRRVWSERRKGPVCGPRSLDLGLPGGARPRWGGWSEAGAVVPARNAQGATQVPLLSRDPCLLRSSAVTVLKFLVVEQRALRFHFALDPANYIVGPSGEAPRVLAHLSSCHLHVTGISVFSGDDNKGRDFANVT